jgi:hypothetical protein
MGAGTRVGAIKFRTSGWLAVAGVLLPGALPAASRHTDIRFALYGGYTIVAQGGVGRLKNLNFIIDTGAVPSVVDQRVARKLGLAGRAEQLSVFNRNLEAQRVVLPDLALGPLRARSVDVRVTDLSAFERALGVPIAGMIGLDVLGSSQSAAACRGDPTAAPQPVVRSFRTQLFPRQGRPWLAGRIAEHRAPPFERQSAIRDSPTPIVEVALRCHCQ